MRDITQANVDHITAVAWRLASNHSQGEELVSQAMVVLTELAISYDPREHKKSSFAGYVSWYGRRRLIDWLRTQDGRLGTLRSKVMFAPTVPMDDAFTDTNSFTYASPDPSPEQVAEDRETMREAADFIQNQLSPRQRAAILSETDDDEAVAKEWNMSVATLQTHRSHARARVRRALHRSG